MLFKLIFFYALSFLFTGCLPAQAGGQAKTVECSFSKLPEIKVAYSRLTILSFQSRPIKVLSGEDSFDISFIKNDLAVKALKPNRKTNLFIYLKNQTCAFRLISVPEKGDEIILIKR